ncbi:hypothetical protein HJC23_003275 [Cyclotella cryptica]|uniref:subtilisin n=1 Tax=Cyclotella cryptica TaxID=29204 RepID=A0ABD3QXK4_9STRA
MNALEIKLNPGQTLEELQNLYPGAQVSPLFTLPRERLIELNSAEEGLPDLTLWYNVNFPIASLVEQTEEEIAASLESLDSINYVDIITNALPAQVGSIPRNTHTEKNNRRLGVTPNFVPNQGYLQMNSQTNNGIDAEYSWTFDGGNGEGITIYDVEWGWDQLHEDLEVAHDVMLLLDEGDVAVLPPGFDNHHGTAVTGEMVGTSNNVGIKGISYGAKLGLAPTETRNLEFRPGNAIMLAVNDAKPGDVILLEIHVLVCGNPVPSDGSTDGFGPVEHYQSVFEATKVATANGITVVEAAGNGNTDLDAPSCQGKYDRSVRDSGAVMVGAGGSGVKCRGGWGGAPREKLDFSTFGSRLDIHGWGECIWSTGTGDGYKDPDARGNENRWYTRTFSGTSGASPFIASAAANIQGIAMKKFGAPLKPAELRQLLTATGLPQRGDVSKKIGPLVNLRKAIDTLLADSPTKEPSAQPMSTSTLSPTVKPTSTSRSPTAKPTASPTRASMSPTAKPTASPTSTSTMSPTAKPTGSPTHPPTSSTSTNPTAISTIPLTKRPTANPTVFPTNAPTTISPTIKPTSNPTHPLTTTTTHKPTAIPSNTIMSPAFKPTAIPTNPTMSPTSKPTAIPTNATMSPTTMAAAIPIVPSKSGKASAMPFLFFKSGKVGKSQKSDKALGESI